MKRYLFALIFPVFASMGTACAESENGLDRQTFIYHPLILEELGPRLDPEVHIGPRIDGSRAYLLKISEDEFADPLVSYQNLWDRIRGGFALPALKGPSVTGREIWYGERKDLVVKISEKARRYLFHIVEAVEKRGLPTELALLPFIESGFEPGALSTAQAAGLWQFIPGTAERYRLALTEQYDARRDIVASTEAALNYLEFLHDIFKDWQLALAAYNWGEEAVLRAVKRNQSKGISANYESLSLPEETRTYVPKLMAIRNIVMSPELHGIELVNIPNRPYFSTIDVDVALDVQSVARLAESSTEEVRALNPSSNSALISGKNRPALLLPTDRIEVFTQNYADYNFRAREIKAVTRNKAARKSIVGLKSSQAKPL